MNTKPRASRMALSEVLAALPGLTRRDVQHWRDAGYIDPARVPRGRIDRFDYGPAFEKIKLMWRFYQEGLSPEAASGRADILLKSGRLAIRTLRERALEVVFSGHLPLRQRLERSRAFWEKRAGRRGAGLAFPGRGEVEDRDIEEALTDLRVRLTAEELEVLAEACLWALDESADAVVGLGGAASVIVGAMCMLALERRPRRVDPFVLMDTGEGPELWGGKAGSALRLVLVAERLGSADGLGELVSLLELKGHQVVQVIAVVEERGKGEAEELEGKGIAICTLLGRDELLRAWAGAGKTGGGEIRDAGR